MLRCVPFSNHYKTAFCYFQVWVSTTSDSMKCKACMRAMTIQLHLMWTLSLHSGRSLWHQARVMKEALKKRVNPTEIFVSGKDFRRIRLQENAQDIYMLYGDKAYVLATIRVCFWDYLRPLWWERHCFGIWTCEYCTLIPATRCALVPATCCSIYLHHIGWDLGWR